jgi:hypothetical protein
MRFTVIGVDQASRDVTLTLDARDIAAARELAALRGVSVVGVAPSQRRRTPFGLLVKLLFMLAISAAAFVVFVTLGSRL